MLDARTLMYNRKRCGDTRRCGLIGGRLVVSRNDAHFQRCHEAVRTTTAPED